MDRRTTTTLYNLLTLKGRLKREREPLLLQINGYVTGAGSQQAAESERVH